MRVGCLGAPQPERDVRRLQRVGHHAAQVGVKRVEVELLAQAAGERLERPRDIGYLSNWMIISGVEYLNVETQLGDVANNATMVDIVQSVFH